MSVDTKQYQQDKTISVQSKSQFNKNIIEQNRIQTRTVDLPAQPPISTGRQESSISSGSKIKVYDSDVNMYLLPKPLAEPYIPNQVVFNHNTVGTEYDTKDQTVKQPN